MPAPLARKEQRLPIFCLSVSGPVPTRFAIAPRDKAEQDGILGELVWVAAARAGNIAETASVARRAPLAPRMRAMSDRGPWRRM